MLDMSQEFGALAHQMGAAPEQVAGGTHLGWIDISLWQHATAQQGGNLLGIDLVLFGLTAVDGFHLEGVSQDEGNALLSAEVGEPIPSEDAFHGHDPSVPIGRHGLEEGFRSGFHIAV
jgi:hypothetical protein